VTDGRHPTSGCVDAETLAAFMDGRLSADERAAVERHLAECEDCYEVWMEARAAQQDAESTAHVVKSRRPWLAGGALVAAALLAAVWLWPVLRPQDPAVAALDDLVRTVGTTRFSEARLSADFAWGETPSATRGTTPNLPVPIHQAALTASTLPDTQQTSFAYRVAAAGHLIMGRHDAAVEALESAVTLDPSDGLVQLDLGAALLERFRHRQVPSDAAWALEATEHALTLLGPHTAARFNRALALEATGRLEDAVTAWDAYLELDASSSWAIEAVDRRRQVLARIGGPALTDVSGLASEHLLALARDEPWRLLDYLDRVVVPGWIDAVHDGQPASLVEGLAIADALKTAGRDLYPHDLLTTLAALPPARHADAASALRSLQASRTAFNLSRYAEAEVAATEAAVMLKRLGLPTHDADIQAAFAHFFGENRVQAVSRSAQIASIAEPRGYLRIAGRAAYMAGQRLTGNVDLTAGLAAYERALDLYSRAGDRAQVAATRSQMMFAATSVGQHEDAWRHAAESVAALNSLATPRLRYMILSNLQYHLRGAGRLHAAIALGPQVQALADGWNDPVYSADAALLQAGLHQRLSQDEAVRQAVASARAYAADIPEGETRAHYDHALDFVEARAFHLLDTGTALPALHRIVDYLVARDRPLLMAEARLLRGRAHAASGDPVAAEADWTAGLSVIEREQSLLKEPHLAVARADRQWDLYAALIAHHHHNHELSLEIAERARARALLTAGTLTTPADRVVADVVANVGSWVPPDVTLLVYAILDDALGLWTVDRGHVTFEQRPFPVGGLDTAVSRFVSALGTSGVSADSQLLVSTLLPERSVYGGRLVVIPDGPLNRLPFGALRLGDGRLLVEAVELSMAPSLLSLKQSIEAPRPGRDAALLVGFGEERRELGLSALPRVSDEVRHIANVYGAASTKLEGPTATADAVIARVPSHGVVHIAGHALADDRRPWESKIFLAPTPQRTALTVSDIGTLRLQPGSLVILSACSTAAGTVFRGEGVISLARPFLAAGASAVLASLWPVRDDDAERVMVAVHRELARGASLAAALATVQRAEIQARPDRWPPWMVLGV